MKNDKAAVDGGGDSSAGDLKNLSKGESKKFDAEAFKKDLVGDAGAKFNIAKDADGNLFLVPVRQGSTPAQPTGVNLEQALDWFPKK